MGRLSLMNSVQLATELGVSQNTLLNPCPSVLGISAVKLITSVKMQMARELLRITVE